MQFNNRRARLLCILGLFCVQIPATIGSEPGDPAGAKQLLQGRQAFSSGHWDVALSLAEAALSARSSDIQSRILKSECLRNLGRFEDSLAAIGNAIEDEPDNNDATICRAKTYYAFGRHSEGIRDIIAVLKRNPKHVPAMLLSIDLRSDQSAHLGKSRSDSSIIKELSEIIQEFPECYEAYSRRASRYLERSEWAKAATDIEKMLAINPDNGESLAYKMLLSHMAGRTEEARALADSLIRRKSRVDQRWGYYCRALTCDSPLMCLADLQNVLKLRHDSGIVFARADILLRVGRYAEALQECDRYVKLGGVKSSELSRIRGECLDNLLLHSDALKEFDHAITVSPSNASVLLGRARCRQVLMHFEGCVNDISELIRLNGANSRCLLGRAAAYVGAEMWNEAIGDVQAVLKKNCDAKEACEAHAILGVCRMGQGDIKAGLAHFRSAYEIAPMAGDVAYTYAAALSQSGQVDAAMRLLSRLQQSNSAVKYESGRSYYDLIRRSGGNRAPEASEALRNLNLKEVDILSQMLAENPRNIVARVMRSQRWYDLGKYDKAIGDASIALEEDPFSPLATLAHVVSLCETDPDSALAECTRWTSAGRRFPHMEYCRALALVGKRDFVRSLDEINRAIDRDRSQGKYFEVRAKCLKELGEEGKSKDDEAVARQLGGHPFLGPVDYMRARLSRGAILLSGVEAGRPDSNSR